MKRILIISSIAFVLACSSKEENNVNPPISDVPEIDISSIDPTSIQQFENVLFEISYLDGDGDIGHEDADSLTLEILDIRDNILHAFHVPPQSPGTGISISGVLVVELENVILLDQSNDSEEIIFNVRIRDRAGNWSNTVTSEPVTVTK